MFNNTENLNQKCKFLNELSEMLINELSLIINLKKSFKNCLDCKKCSKIAYKKNSICFHDFCTNFVNNKIKINNKTIQIVNYLEHGSKRPAIFFQIALNSNGALDNKELKTYSFTSFIIENENKFYIEHCINYNQDYEEYRKYFCFSLKEEMKNYFKDEINNAINYFSNLSYDD